MIPITNVFVVDDDPAGRDSLRMMLKAAKLTVTTFPSADEFLAFYHAETIGCIILDINMPGMNGTALQQELNQRGSQLPIIFLTGQGSIPLSARAFKAGAVDFLTKPANGKELLACVNQALEKCTQLQIKAQETQSIRTRLATLTEREKDVMMLIIEGLTNKEIAQKLGISFRTVESHRAQVMHKTNALNIVDLAHLAGY